MAKHVRARFEVFNPRDGRPLFTFRFQLVARFVAWVTLYEYEASGVGWVTVR